MENESLETQSVVQTPPIISTPPPAPKSKRPIILVLTIVFFLLLAVGASAFYFGKMVSNTTVSSVIKTTPTPTVDPTVSWKTYTENRADIGYSFQYPSNWKILNANEGCIGPVLTDTSLFFTICGPYLAPNDTPESSVGRSSGKIVSKQSVTVGGHEGIQQEFPFTDNTIYQYTVETHIGQVNTKVTMRDGKVEQQNGIIIISISVQDATKLEKAKQQYSQILSTFKFTN